MLKITAGRTALIAGLSLSLPAWGWGDLGHEVTALIAYRHLNATARAALDRLLSSDSDSLTAPDFASRTLWADRYRTNHRETAAWHFIDIEIDHPDPAQACYGFPPLPAGATASQGPANDCVVNKIDEFMKELKDPATAPQERLLALKFMIHFVGDLHQPLHASDHQDRGGNCVALSPSPDGAVNNLHAYWDVTVVSALGTSAADIAARIDVAGPDDAHIAQGDARQWAQESFELAKRDVYTLAMRPTCQNPGSVELPPAYRAQAEKDAPVQLRKAGLRMAYLLNQALSP